MGKKSAKQVASFLGTSALTRPLFALGAASVLLGAGPAQALDAGTLPQNPNVVGGKDSFSQSGNTLNVNQSTNRTVIDWRSFDIGSKAQVNFNQPGTSSIAVNRVNGSTNPTDIEGGLHANGQVWILNPNGVFFGKSARVDAAGIVASTANIDDKAFMSGSNKLQMTGADHGSVENQGNISVGANGLAAFVAPSVRNSGTINATVGRVALAAGTTYTLDLAGDHLVELGLGSVKAVVDNSGKIVNPGGTIALTAKAAGQVVNSVVNVSGVVTASSASTSGGTITLGGDNVTTTSTAQLSADAGTNGNGGTITSVANVQGNYAGSFSAKGGSSSGNGGSVETSGKNVHIDDSIKINTLASNGYAGSWTLDPVDLDITSGGSTGQPVDTNASTVTTGTIEDQLATTGVTLSASNSITVDGAIDTHLQSSSTTLALNNSGTGSLTIDLNAPITLGASQHLTGQGNVVNVANNGLIQNGVDAALTGGATVNVAAGTYNLTSDINLNKAGLTLAGAAGAKLVVPYVSGFNGIDVYANDVTVEGLEIAGPVNSSWQTYDWTTNGLTTRGIFVHTNVTNFTITDNNIHDLRNDILIDGRNTGSITNNTIENSKSGISVQYTDAGAGNSEGYIVAIAGNKGGTYGNEWGINTHLNGHYVGTPTNLVGNAVKIATNAPTNIQQALLNFSTANNGMTAQDQGYAQSNRTAVTVSTAGSDASQGSVLSTLGTIQGGINAVVSGGVVNVLNGVYTVLSGTYINITKSLSLIGQSESGVVINARNASTYGLRVSGPNSNVDLENFTLYGSSNYGLKAENTSNLTLANITSRGAGKSEFDLNGILGGTLTNLTADGAPVSDGTDSTTTAGNGIGITDSQNVTLTGVSTKNNAWGGLALYQTNSPSGYPYQETGIVVDGSNHFAEANGIYAQNQSSTNVFGTIDLTGQGIQYIAQANIGYVSPLDTNEGTYTYFQKTEQGAVDAAVGLNTKFSRTSAAVQGYAGTSVDGNNAFYVGTSGGVAMSIQAAVDAAASDATIDVLAGNYSGQVVITKSLTLEGAGSGNTTISAPDVLSHSFTAGGNPYKAVVSIEGGANVSVSGLTVDGRGVGDANNRLLGIGIYDSSATIDGVTVTRVRGGGLTGSLNGVQAGTGIEAYNDGSTPQTVTVKNSVINDFQKNGIAFVGKGISATATGNTITGAGNTTLIAQNGVEVFGVNGTISGANISNNLITGLSYGNSETVASSILLINAGGASVSDNTISSAGGTGSYGVVVQGSNNVTISGNTLSNLEEGVDISTADGTTVTGGSITDTQLGIWADTATATNLNVTGVSFARNTEQFYGPSGNVASVLANNTFDRSVTVLDGGQYGNDIFSSIQDGVNSAVSGDTVQVGAGTYQEQVVVSSKNLDIEGAGYGNSIIEAPDLLGHSFTSNGGTYKAVVSIENGSNVTLAGFTIDGLGKGNANNNFLGVGIHNANATLDGLDITGVRDGGVSGTLDGAQAGTGVEAFNDDGTARTVTLENSSIEDFQKAGAAFLGGNLTANVENNTITGAGNTTLIAQNGVEFYGLNGGVVTGTISGNTISGLSYGNNETIASSIVLIGASGTTVENNTVTGTGGTGGYGLDANRSNNLTIANNDFSNLEEGVVLYNGANISITGGSISGSTVAGLDADPSVTGLSVSGVNFSNNAIQFLGSASNVASIFDDNVFDRSVMVSGGDNIYSHVQDGVNAANAGGTVTVGNGIYVEQVTIDKDLDLIGAGAGRTIIEAPSVMATSFTTTGGAAQKAIITVDNGANANISDLTVNGAGLGNANAAFDGIAIHNANATIASVAVEGVRGNPLNGAQNGVGIVAYNDDGHARTVSVTDSAISDFQKNGIAFIGGNLTVDVEGNTITGAGSTGLIAQNGIELFGTTGTITGTVAGNTVTGINYSGNNNSATDILLINASGTTVQGNTITGTGAGDTSNGIYVSGSTGVTLAANTITNTGFGIDIDNGFGTANVTVLNNSVTNNGVGMEVAYQEGDTSVVTAHGNDFSNNASSVELESAAATLDATGNWWGTSSDTAIQSGLSGADASDVNFSSFLASGTDTSTAMGFQGDFSHLIVTSLGSGTNRIGEAISEVSTGGTIDVNTGTYAESVSDSKQLAFDFGNVTVNSFALASGAAGSSLNGNLTATGAITSAGAANLNGNFNAGSIALNGAATLTGDTSLNATGNVTVASVIGGGNDLSLGGASNTLGNVAGVGALTVSGPATLTGTSYAANTAKLGAVTLTGDTTVDANTISVASVTGAGNDLTLDGATSLGNVAGAGALAVNGASTLTGNSYAGTSLNFGGAVTLTNDTALNASGATTVASVIGGGNDLTITGTSNTLGNVAGVGALAVNGAATLTGVSYVAGSMDFDAVKLANSAALNTSSDNGALVIASVDGTTAGAQSLTVNAGSGKVSLGNLGATTRLGAVSDASKTTLTGSTYNANSFLFGGDVTLISANTTLNTTQSSSAAGGITFQGDLFGTTDGGQSLTLIAGPGTGAAAANGDITLQNAGTTAVNLNNLTVSGDNFTALTVDLAGNYNSQLTGNQVFAADTLNVKGNATSNVGGDASGHIVSGGDVNIVATGDVSGTISGQNVNLTGDDVNANVTASDTAAIQGNTVEGSYTADTVTLTASNNVNAAVNATDFTLSAQHGSVDGTWATIDTSGSNVVSLNGQTTVGLADINPNQLVVEGFALPLGSRIGANGQLILPQGVLLGLLSPGGGKPKMILVHSVQQLGELLAGGYSVIVIDLSNRDSGKPIQLASN